MHDTEVLIIGGGLAGLRLAAQLAKARRDVCVVEARDRLGGRILSHTHGGATFDMGPAWFWPGQPRIAGLIADLGLSRFDQYASGDLLFEDAQGRVQRGQGFASMQGSFRLRGGLGALIRGLADQIPPASIHLGTPIQSIEKTPQGLIATARDGRRFSAAHVVLALPPRIANTLAFSPELPPQAHNALSSTPTWMAGQAKAMAIYDRPFWREAGLSGDAMSRHGPMVEIHDASPADDSLFALFGFIGVPPAARQDVALLEEAIRQQLARLFGPAAATPRDLRVKDWAFDAFTATAADRAALSAHPHYGLPPALAGLWDGRLHLAGTEVAPEFGGYLEGALEAADHAFAKLDLVKA